MASEKLRRKVRGVDLAVLESTFRDGQEDYAKLYGHMTVSQAKEVGKLAKRAIFVHQMPQDYFGKMTCAVIETVKPTTKGRPSSSPRRHPRRRR